MVHDICELLRVSTGLQVGPIPRLMARLLILAAAERDLAREGLSRTTEMITTRRRGHVLPQALQDLINSPIALDVHHENAPGLLLAKREAIIWRATVLIILGD